MEQNNGL